MPKDPLQVANEALDKAIEAEKRNKAFLASIGPSIVNALTPALNAIRSAVSQMKVDVKPEVKINPEINIPELDTSGIERSIRDALSDFRVPTPQVNYTAPTIKFPELKWPEGNMPIEGLVSLKGVGLGNPLPVQLRDASGKPVSLDFESLNVMSGGGGKSVVKIGGIVNSAYADYLNSDNRLRVSVESGGSGLTDTELRAAHLDVQQVSGSVDSVNLNQVGGNSVVVGTGYQDNALRVVHATDAIVSVRVDGSSASVAANIVDSGGVPYTTTNPLPVGDAGGSLTVDATNLDIRDLTSSDIVTVQDITNSVKTALVDSAGVQYSGSNPVPITGSVSVSGSITSSVAVGPTAADTADDGNPPIQTGGIARTANPTAVAANDVVKSTYDDVGRQVVRQVQVRDLIQTARASVTNVTETTLLAGSASTFHDLIYIMASNNSTGATAIDIRSGTANGIVLTIDIPANSPAGVALPVPIPQDVAANAWTFQQQGDVSNTTVVVSALFSKEV